jgi:hypothetical protein
MTSLLINYADGGYYEAQKLNSKTGLLSAVSTVQSNSAASIWIPRLWSATVMS